MKKHQVEFKVSLKGIDIAKRFRTNIPAESDIDAYDKCLAFAEDKIKIEVLSINETEFIVPDPEPDELDELIELGEVAKVMKELDKWKEENENNFDIETVRDYPKMFRKAARVFRYLADKIENELK